MTDFVEGKICDEDMSGSEDNMGWKKYGRNANHDVIENNNDSDVDDNPTGLEGAAFKSRLPANKMTSIEAQCFADIVAGPTQGVQVYLCIRNRILELWLEDPKKELTFEAALDSIDPPFNSNGPLGKYLLIGYSICLELLFLYLLSSCSYSCLFRPARFDQFWCISTYNSHSSEKSRQGYYYWCWYCRTICCPST